MSDAATPPPIPANARTPSQSAVLRRLFLTLFLRGRSSRGLQRSSAPKSVGQKLALTLVFYALFGLIALSFLGRPVFALAVYLHGVTFMFLGMFVASSAGEILFNKEEADILLHRPVDTRSLLWSKIRVLVQVSLWLAGALNLVGLIAGMFAFDGGWRFPLAHAVSTTLEALFCTGCIVLVYQLCLRWLGRERLEGLMTMAQVIVSVAAVLAGQLLPQLMMRFGGKIQFSANAWWVVLVPPAWFASFDDALSGNGSPAAWVLAGVAVAVTALVLWLTFGKLARDYETGWQTLSETVSKPRRRRTPGRRWIDIAVNTPPLRWWLRDPVSRASFLLTAAYLVRDRDVKLRIYPGLAPMLVLPFIFLLRRGGMSAGFGVAFSGCYLGLMPLMGLNLLQYSQQWQAADVFRTTPLRGPAPVFHGARRAVLLFLTLPLLVIVGILVWFMTQGSSQLLLLLPGLIALPIYALIPCLNGKAVPLSVPTEDAKSANRGLVMGGVSFVAMALAGIAWWSWSEGLFWWLILGETIFVIGLYVGLRYAIEQLRWQPIE